MDGSSIYLLDDGLPWKTKKPPEVSAEKFDGDIVRGKKILIKSDGVDISGRDDVSINAGKDVYISGEEVFIHARAGSTIKLGPPNALFIPTIHYIVESSMSFCLSTFALHHLCRLVSSGGR